MPPPLRTLAALMLAACAGCGSTAPSRFFALTALEPGAEPAAGEVLVLVDPVGVAEYLDRPQLVRRTSAVELEVDDYSRWAEPLDEALTRVLASDLRQLLASDRAGPDAGIVRVACHVSRFEADEQGRAVLEARWTITPIAPAGSERRSSWLGRTDLRHPDDPAELAAALDALVHDLARALATELTR